MGVGMATSILFLKTGALGDVLRTTSVLPGLKARHGEVHVVWVTHPAAVDLVRTHPLVDEILPVDPRDSAGVERARARLASRSWDRVLSLDDEEPMCALASAIPCRHLSGAFLGEGGRRTYTPDVAAWFDMGLLSVHGKERADALKVANRRSHPEIFAEMLGVAMGRPRLELPQRQRAWARARFEDWGVGGSDPVVGLNTGAGGRWPSKALPEERVVALARAVAAERGGGVRFLVMGGPEERGRNDRLLEALADLGAVDAGTENSLLEFAALIDRADLVVTSDSLALHMAVARRTRLVAFFAPTSAAEIELYGEGEKVVSTAPDACSYRPDADTSTLTVERLAAAVGRQLQAWEAGGGRPGNAAAG